MHLCQEVQCFIIACEVIQSIFAGGGTLAEMSWACFCWRPRIWGQALRDHWGRYKNCGNWTVNEAR